jgi:hypothetical protein
MNTNTGGQAFPAFEHHPGYMQMMAVGGMTLRDYFAAKAMQAMLSNPGCNLGPLSQIPSAAFEMADAMLKAREVKA